MLRQARFNLVIVIAAIFLFSSCAQRACKVKSSKQKWKHYNSLQYGGGAQKKR